MLGSQRQKPILVKRATQSAPTPRELPNGWEKTTQKYSYHADTFTRSSGHAHYLKTFSRTPYRTRTRLGHSRDAMRPPHVTPRAQGARDPPHHDLGRLPCHGDHAQNCTAAPARVRSHTTGTAKTPSDDTHKHWQTTAAPTHTSMVQRVPGRGSTQGTQGISPEPLRPPNPALPHAAARSACRGAPGSPASPKRLVRAREDGGEDGSPTLVRAHGVE